MKNVKKIASLLIVILIATSSCKKEDNSSSTGQSATTVLSSNIQQGSWIVTSFIENGVNQTNHYTGYQFQFGTSGTVTAVNGGSTVSGTWSSGNDDSQLKLILSFGSVAPFQELNSDWHVTQNSSTIIKLEDVSGGSGGIDYLTFEKI